ncbi:hypothetical protein KXR83_04915 [Williamsia muralis]|uniref:hypothetical protein n=1 Tax=Williamsia marianensis TaxID=85044 RepID=UPI003F17ABEF
MNATRTVRDVELIKVGHWDVSTGPWSPGPADLKSAVAAHAAGVLRKPVIKLGHVDDRFDGEPAFGYVDNLRVTDNGNTLIGDLIGLPAWLADALPLNYPDRSVEALQDVRAADGTTWPLVLTGCALLGATAPGIDSLASLQGLIAARKVTLPALRTQPATSTPDHHLLTIAAARRRRTHRKG